MTWNKQIIITKFLGFLGWLLGKEFMYYSKNEHNGLGMTAIKSSLGFWYAGNVLSPLDIAYGIMNNGIVEKEGSELVVKILEFELRDRTKFIFYDIGANTGYFGILAAFLGHGKIFTYSFEPIIEYNKVESETIRMNRLENFCSIFNVALDNQAGETDFFLAGSGSTLNPDFLGKGKFAVRKVKKVILDEFADSQKLEFPDFMKIDVEGLEYGVLSGAMRIIGKNFPVIWYETARVNKLRKYSNEDFFKTKILLEQMGYEVFITGPQGLGDIDVNFNLDGSYMFLALHKQKHHNLKAFLMKSYQ